MFISSKYNFFVEYNNSVLLYNALNDIVVPIDKNDNDELLKLMDNPDLFQNEKPELFEKFCNWGFIIDNDFNEVDYIKYRNHLEVFDNRTYRLTINPTLDCNMHCWYCTVDAAGVEKTPASMSNDTILNIKQYTSKLIKDRQVDGFFLDWFGGEPMLYFKKIILPISLHVKSLTEKYKMPFTNYITTNGYLINRQIINDFNEISLNLFQITLDGNEKRHNTVRKHYGQPSFNKILENINLICEYVNNPNINLRINYDRKTLDNITEIIPKIPKKNRNKITISFIKVFQIKKKDDEIENLLLKNMIKEFEKEGFNMRYWAFQPKSFLTCYADSYYHRVINFDGNIYKCTARDYGEDMKLGKIEKHGVIKWNHKVLSSYFAEPAFFNDKCLNCKVLPLCFGPCIQKAWEVKTNKAKFECQLDHSELSIETFIISEAEKRNLI